jgi:hypothetical protein
MKHPSILSKPNSPLSPSPRKRKRVGLSLWEEHRLRHCLRRAACSETWVDDQIKILHDTDSAGTPILYRFHDSTVFPPGGKSTPMRWCRSCGRFTPPNSIHLIEHRRSRAGQVCSATLQCDDCRISADTETYRELYDAHLFLRPSSSMSFVRLRELFSERRQR